MSSQAQRCHVFKSLHEGSTWIIPNPWDAGSARILAGLGFKALATTSGGLAFTLGKADGEVSLEQMLHHCNALTAATDLPVNADFENGYAEDIHVMADNITRLAETGVAGISIEDFSRDTRTLYPLTQAIERVQAAAEAIKTTGLPILLTARAESLLRGFDDTDEIIERLQAFESVGADVLYAPAIRSLDVLQQITSEISKPFNVLVSFIKDASVEQLAAAGANRISVGGALTYAAIAPLLEAGTEMLEQGTFGWLNRVANAGEIRRILER